jgi:hypothetical protein
MPQSSVPFPEAARVVGIRSILSSSVSANGGAVRRDGPVVEAFPNAFLGVLMPEVELVAAPRLKRRRRFDWLYERMVTGGKLESVMSKSLDLSDESLAQLTFRDQP